MDRISEFQSIMKERKIFAYIVPTDDFHGSEYVSAHFRLREYLSGFTGSAGTLVVTENSAYLWTDSRYFIQAKQQLSDGITLMKQGLPETPTIVKFLQDTMPRNSFLGFDGRCLSTEFVRSLKQGLSEKNIVFKTDDLGDLVWKNRPTLPKQPVIALPESVCGISRAEKLSVIREKMREQNADFLLTSAPDEIAWTLNLRGGDVDYNPVFLSFMLVGERVRLFAERSIFSEKIAAELAADGVEILPYNDVYYALKSLNGAVLADPKAVNYELFSSISESCKIIEKRSPIVLLKAVKNPAEIAAEKRAHLKDGLAVTRFMMWLEGAVGREIITEISAAEKLEEFRSRGENYLGQSFAPIMAYGAHGAIVHYSATSQLDAEILPRGLLLSDTGGHYLDGTTDITRTFVLGELTLEEKRAFTLVLAGHLELLNAVFPAGVRGSTLDYAARAPLWRELLDYGHGTGHGVGFLLNVHEGPQRISRSAVGDEPLRAGMITSDEPGFYAENKFGIRHESLLLCESRGKSEYGEFLGFSPLTLVPFDPRGVEKSLLSPRQVEYFNNYQQFVFEQLSPHLEPAEKEWLRKITQPI